MDLAKAFELSGGGQWYNVAEGKDAGDAQLRRGDVSGLIRMWVPGSLWTLEMFSDEPTPLAKVRSDRGLDSEVLKAHAWDACAPQ